VSGISVKTSSALISYTRIRRRKVRLMLDASVVEEYQPGVACNLRFFVVAQHNFGMRELVVPGGSEACIRGACWLAVGCWDGSVAVEDVAG
jgi:hypothetical protein